MKLIRTESLKNGAIRRIYLNAKSDKTLARQLGCADLYAGLVNNQSKLKDTRLNRQLRTVARCKQGKPGECRVTAMNGRVSYILEKVK